MRWPELRRRAGALLLAGFLAVAPGLLLAATEADVDAVGEQIVCYCGCSGQTVAACTCGTADQIRERIAGQLDSGLSIDEVVQVWVDERGEAILANPTREGFNLVGWIMPFVVSLLGLGAVTVMLLRWQRRSPPLAPVPGSLSPEDRADLERIEREVRRLNG